MGKKKIDIELMANSTSRNVTFCKRKKGLLKKAIELSKLCGINVSLYIYDKNIDKLVAYNSSKEFNITGIDKCI